MDYMTIKWLHVLSSAILFGTGIGIAFFMFAASRERNPANIHFTLRYVVLADWCFTTPSVIFQFASGLYLVHLGRFHMSDIWLVYALVLYVFAAVCWLPVVWMQIRMRDMAAFAVTTGAVLPENYWQFFGWWIVSGSLAFPAVAAIFWLMVVKAG